ncbi:MAG: endolytic transglycosylase MltG [Lachnospiraceae bacterium]
MSRMTKEINKITGTIISVSGKLIIYAVVLLLLFEGTTKGYEFGHEIFYATAVDQGVGIEKTVSIPKGQSTAETAHMLKQSNLIVNDLAFQVQKKFYDYEIHPGTYVLSSAMTSKEILQILNEKPQGADTDASVEVQETPAETLEETSEDGLIGEGSMEVQIQIDDAESGDGQ